MPQTSILGYFNQGILYSEKPQYDSTASQAPDSNLIEVKNPESAQQHDQTPSGSVDFGPNKTSLSAGFLTQSDVFVPEHCPQAAIVRVQPSQLPRLKVITTTLLPVRYPESFYNECVQDNGVGDLCRVLLWSSMPVGWVRCRLEPGPNGQNQLYIQAIGVLAPYRTYGLASALLQCVIQPDLVRKYNMASVYAHVWQSNGDALEWYEKRGFKRLRLEEHYYRRLRPSGAWIMEKHLP